MSFLNAIHVGLREILANKFRSVLTMLGIVLGVASLVAMGAIVKGMENGMKESMIALGGLDKALTREAPVPVWQAHRADQAPGRTLRDVEALRRSAPLVKLVSPEMELARPLMSRGERRVKPSELLGVWPVVLDMNLHVLEHGRFFNDLDEENASAVCVIGTGIRDALFGSPDELGREVIPIGDHIQINSQPFTIIGMFQHYESDRERKKRELARDDPDASRKPLVERGRPSYRSASGGSSWAFERKNMTAYIPMNTMWLRFRASSGIDAAPDPTLSDIDLKVNDLSEMEAALGQARNVLLTTHGGIEDFTFSTQENTIQNINTAIRNARVSGGVIAAISLIVGGIGIMNIMLASITERIREIGIRKAIGATFASIFTQILVESSVIAVLGGILGLAVSFALVHLLAVLAAGDNVPEIVPATMLLAFAFSVIVGLLSGLFPAIKAARLSPIEALRYS